MRGSKTNLDHEYTCKIRLLDDSEISCDFKRDAKGQLIFGNVCNKLNLVEQDYFGLRFVDNNKQRHWLDVSKDLMKQLKYTRQPYMFFFRVRFYPSDPSRLQEEITRYQLFLQLKRDILHGRLLCPFNHITELAAYVVQAEVGDYDPDEHKGNYVSELKLLPRQSEKLEERIAEIHKTLSGQVPADAEAGFLEKARHMDLYGVDPHPCRDQDDTQLYLGLTPQGIQIIRDAKRVSGFAWSEVAKVSYESRTFYVQAAGEKKKTNYAFRLNDTPACKHLWRCTVEHLAFYSEDPIKAQSPRRSLLSPSNILRKKYTFGGKTESQLQEEAVKIARSAPNFERTPSLRIAVPKKPPLPSRSSMVPTLDDRSSQDSSETKGNNHHASFVALNDQGHRRSSSDRSDPLKAFETEEFPPEPPLDASRTSMVFDDDISRSDSIHHLSNHADHDNTAQSENMGGKQSCASGWRWVGSWMFWVFVIALLLIPVAIIVQTKYLQQKPSLPR